MRTSDSRRERPRISARITEVNIIYPAINSTITPTPTIPRWTKIASSSVGLRATLLTPSATASSSCKGPPRRTRMPSLSLNKKLTPPPLSIITPFQKTTRRTVIHHRRRPKRRMQAAIPPKAKAWMTTKCHAWTRIDDSMRIETSPSAPKSRNAARLKRSRAGSDISRQNLIALMLRGMPDVSEKEVSTQYTEQTPDVATGRSRASCVWSILSNTKRRDFEE